MGLYDAVKPKLVLGENIVQTFQFVESGAADAGIVALWVAATSAGMKRLAPRAIDGPTSRTLRRFAPFAPTSRSPRDQHQPRLPSLASATIRGPTTRASGIGQWAIH
jgi:ABC-type molybdate transport system substrate-binding protein